MADSPNPYPGVPEHRDSPSRPTERSLQNLLDEILLLNAGRPNRCPMRLWLLERIGPDQTEQHASGPQNVHQNEPRFVEADIGRQRRYQWHNHMEHHGPGHQDLQPDEEDVLEGGWWNREGQNHIEVPAPIMPQNEIANQPNVLEAFPALLNRNGQNHNEVPVAIPNAVPIQQIALEDAPARIIAAPIVVSQAESPYQPIALGDAAILNAEGGDQNLAIPVAVRPNGIQMDNEVPGPLNEAINALQMPLVQNGEGSQPRASRKRPYPAAVVSPVPIRRRNSMFWRNPEDSDTLVSGLIWKVINNGRPINMRQRSTSTIEEIEENSSQSSPLDFDNVPVCVTLPRHDSGNSRGSSNSPVCSSDEEERTLRPRENNPLTSSTSTQPSEASASSTSTDATAQTSPITKPAHQDTWRPTTTTQPIPSHDSSSSENQPSISNTNGNDSPVVQNLVQEKNPVQEDVTCEKAGETVAEEELDQRRSLAENHHEPVDLSSSTLLVGSPQPSASSPHSSTHFIALARHEKAPEIEKEDVSLRTTPTADQVVSIDLNHSAPMNVSSQPSTSSPHSSTHSTWLVSASRAEVHENEENDVLKRTTLTAEQDGSNDSILMDPSSQLSATNSAHYFTQVLATSTHDELPGNKEVAPTSTTGTTDKEEPSTSTALALHAEDSAGEAVAEETLEQRRSPDKQEPTHSSTPSTSLVFPTRAEVHENGEIDAPKRTTPTADQEETAGSNLSMVMDVTSESSSISFAHSSTHFLTTATHEEVSGTEENDAPASTTAIADQEEPSTSTVLATHAEDSVGEAVAEEALEQRRSSDQQEPAVPSFNFMSASPQPSTSAADAATDSIAHTATIENELAEGAVDETEPQQRRSPVADLEEPVDLSSSTGMETSPEPPATSSTTFVSCTPATYEENPEEEEEELENISCPQDHPQEIDGSQLSTNKDETSQPSSSVAHSSVDIIALTPVTHEEDDGGAIAEEELADQEVSIDLRLSTLTDVSSQPSSASSSHHATNFLTKAIHGNQKEDARTSTTPTADQEEPSTSTVLTTHAEEGSAGEVVAEKELEQRRSPDQQDSAVPSSTFLSVSPKASTSDPGEQEEPAGSNLSTIMDASSQSSSMKIELNREVKYQKGEMKEEEGVPTYDDFDNAEAFDEDDLGLPYGAGDYENDDYEEYINEEEYVDQGAERISRTSSEDTEAIKEPGEGEMRQEEDVRSAGEPPVPPQNDQVENEEDGDEVPRGEHLEVEAEECVEDEPDSHPSQDMDDSEEVNELENELAQPQEDVQSEAGNESSGPDETGSAAGRTEIETEDEDLDQEIRGEDDAESVQERPASEADNQQEEQIEAEENGEDHEQVDDNDVMAIFNREQERILLEEEERMADDEGLEFIVEEPSRDDIEDNVAVEERINAVAREQENVDIQMEEGNKKKECITTCLHLQFSGSTTTIKTTKYGETTTGKCETIQGVRSMLQKNLDRGDYIQELHLSGRREDLSPEDFHEFFAELNLRVRCLQYEPNTGRKNCLYAVLRLLDPTTLSTLHIVREQGLYIEDLAKLPLWEYLEELKICEMVGGIADELIEHNRLERINVVLKAMDDAELDDFMDAFLTKTHLTDFDIHLNRPIYPENELFREKTKPPSEKEAVFFLEPKRLRGKKLPTEEIEEVDCLSLLFD